MAKIIDENIIEYPAFTKVVRQLYEYLFGDPWPSGWKVYPGVDGVTLPELKAVLLTADSLSHEGDIASLVHELVHMRNPEWEHDGTFLEEEVRQIERALEWFGGHCSECGRPAEGEDKHGFVSARRPLAGRRPRR